MRSLELEQLRRQVQGIAYGEEKISREQLATVLAGMLREIETLYRLMDQRTTQRRVA